MKSIGIITIHKSNNYGACLQAYALYTYLSQKGYKCEIIDLYRPVHKDYILSKKYRRYREKKEFGIKKILKKVIHKLKNITKKEHAIKGLTQETEKKFNDFNSLLTYSKPYKSIDSLYNDPPKYDIYITGSDQVWNPTMPFGIEPYFLTFVNNGGKKISYAASIGISELYENEKADFRKWLNDFDKISVREKNGVDLLKQFCEKEITQVMDPTFLLEKSYWKSQIVAPKYDKPYILLFTLSYSPLLLEFAKKIKEESNKELIYLCTNQPASTGNYLTEKEAGPKEFLGYIAKASLVITNSFHGTVFSIIMNTNNFMTFISKKQNRGKRITDLLEMLNLSNHVFSEDDLSLKAHDIDNLIIDQEKTDVIFQNLQNNSRQFIMNAITD